MAHLNSQGCPVRALLERGFSLVKMEKRSPGNIMQIAVMFPGEHSVLTGMYVQN